MNEIEIKQWPVAEKKWPAERLFTRNVLDQILEAMRAAIDDHDPDLSTVAGRKSIASLAHRVARTKTAVDEAGKGYVAELKALPAQIDAQRKYFRDECDRLRDEARRPLTEWEDGHARADAHIASLSAMATEAESGRIDSQRMACLIESMPECDRCPIDRIGEVDEAAMATRRRIYVAMVAKIAEESEAEEIERARAEAAEAARQETERIKEAARRQAEAERIRQAEERAKEDAERRVRIAEDAARQREARLVAENERIRRESSRIIPTPDPPAAPAIVSEIPPADEPNDVSKKVNKIMEAVASLRANGYSEREAQRVVSLIAAGKIKNVVIS